jgi:hypothetical protein
MDASQPRRYNLTSTRACMLWVAGPTIELQGNDSFVIAQLGAVNGVLQIYWVIDLSSHVMLLRKIHSHSKGRSCFSRGEVRKHARGWISGAGIR